MLSSQLLSARLQDRTLSDSMSIRPSEVPLMRFRLVPAFVLVLVLAACGGGTAPTAPPSTAGTGPGGTASAAPAATGAAIDLSNVDVCAIVPEGTADLLTGETGFDADPSSGGSRCFWGRPGAPQYLEVEVGRARPSLEGYGITFNNVPCPGVPVPGVGTEAVGAVCTPDQTKVWLAAIDQGVFVQVLVNEPKGALTPADLATVVNAVVAGLD